jgi:hypothetical protein
MMDSQAVVAVEGVIRELVALAIRLPLAPRKEILVVMAALLAIKAAAVAAAPAQQDQMVAPTVAMVEPELPPQLAVAA